MRPPKDPLARTPLPLQPPAARSRTALGLTAAAARGLFRLQHCDRCATVQYPPRDICVACLHDSLPLRDTPPEGTLLAATTVRVTADPYFRRRPPARTGLVRMDAGPNVIAQIAGPLAPGDRVRLALRLDRAGQGIMLATPLAQTLDVADDPLMHELSCDPAHRRVLVTDGRSRAATAIARALQDAGAEVLVGIAEEWRPFEPVAGATVVPLDLTDADSIRRLAGGYGGRIEIVVNTGARLRPGATLPDARAEMEAAYFGPLRLLEALGPALRARAADGPDGASAWVNVLSTMGLTNRPGWEAASAAAAAARALAQSARAALRPIRVLDLLAGPLDDDWNEALPPPKVAPTVLASALLRGLRHGLEEVAVGDVAQDLLARFHDDPKILERELNP